MYDNLIKSPPLLYKAWEIDTSTMYNVSSIVLIPDNKGATNNNTPSEPYFFDENGDIHIISQCIMLQAVGVTEIEPNGKPGNEIFIGDIVECRRDGDKEYTERVEIKDIKCLPRALFGSSLLSRHIVGNIFKR